MDSDTVKKSDGIKLLGLSKKSTGATLNSVSGRPRLYPGDLVCYKANKPYEWMPWYGQVLNPNNYSVRYLLAKHKSQSLSLPSVKSGPATPSTTTAATISGSATLASLTGATASRKTFSDKASTLKSEFDDQLEDLFTSWNHEEGLPFPIYVQWTHSHRIGAVHDSAEVITLVDRYVSKGQRVKNDDGLEGTVVDTKGMATLQVLNTNHVIDSVEIKQLNPVSPFIRGREILYRGWIGVIKAVHRDVTCRLDLGGAVFKLKSSETDGFVKRDPYWGTGMPCPGLRNKFTPTIMKRAKFDSRMFRFAHRFITPISYLFTRAESTTIGMETNKIEVIWLEKCPNSDMEYKDPPLDIIADEELLDVKLLGLPSYETVGLNSVRMYVVKDDDAVITYSNWFAGFQSKFFSGPSTSTTGQQLNPTPSRKASLLCQPGYELPVKVVYRQMEAQIAWDNGVKEYMLAARIPILLPVPPPDDEFLPGCVVELLRDPSAKKYGTISYGPDFKKKGSNMVNVHWVLPEPGGGKDLGVASESIYDLKPHSTICSYNRGTTVYFLDHPEGFVAGTVIGSNLLEGKLVVAVPDSIGEISVYPHTLQPLSQRCIWNFHLRKWENEYYVPPNHHIVEENIGIPKEVTLPPLNIRAMGNNGNISRIRVGDIVEEPQFAILESAPEYHRYKTWELRNPSDELLRAIKSELKNITTGENLLPEGLWIRAYEDRNDLYSAMILGRENTPYEDGLFFFDLQITEGFPAVPPRIHHIPYTKDSVSAYIARDGTFCTSKFDWNFGDNPPHSFIVHAMHHLKRMVFSAQPYFTEDGREIEYGTNAGQENSRLYNENIFMNIFTSYYDMAMRPYNPWRKLIEHHLSVCLPFKISCVKDWIKLSNEATDNESVDMDSPMPPSPSFLLLPVSRGFQAAITGRVESLEKLFPPSTGYDEEKMVAIPQRPKSPARVETESEDSSRAISGTNITESAEANVSEALSEGEIITLVE